MLKISQIIIIFKYSVANKLAGFKMTGFCAFSTATKKLSTYGTKSSRKFENICLSIM